MQALRFSPLVSGVWFCLVMGGQPAAGAAPGQADMQWQIRTTLQEFADAKTDAQRAEVGEYLQHLDRAGVIAALIDRIEHSRNGKEATLYNSLIDVLKPEACAEVSRQIGQTQEVEPKAKLIVALRHCQGADNLALLTAALADKRPVHFEAHGKTPRRVCDLAYDELFLKLRADPRFGFDPSPKMKGVIRESTPIKERDRLIGQLSGKLAPPTPGPSALPATTAATPAPSSPAAASPRPSVKPSPSGSPPPK